MYNAAKITLYYWLKFFISNIQDGLLPFLAKKSFLVHSNPPKSHQKKLCQVWSQKDSLGGNVIVNIYFNFSKPSFYVDLKNANGF